MSSPDFGVKAREYLEPYLPDCSNDEWAMILKQFAVFVEVIQKYAEKNKEYKDNWTRMGWRGQLVRVRERAERLWDSLWDEDPNSFSEAKLDDDIDLINFAAFLIRAVRSGNRDGSWW